MAAWEKFDLGPLGALEKVAEERFAAVVERSAIRVLRKELAQSRRDAVKADDGLGAALFEQEPAGRAGAGATHSEECPGGASPYRADTR